MNRPVINVQCPRCLHCGEIAVVQVYEDEFTLWQRGEYIQKAMPEMPKEQREMLISGTHPECFAIMFPPEEEEDE